MKGEINSFLGLSGAKLRNEIEIEDEIEIEWRAVSISISWVGCGTVNENASEMYDMWGATATNSTVTTANKSQRIHGVQTLTKGDALFFKECSIALTITVTNHA